MCRAAVTLAGPEIVSREKNPHEDISGRSAPALLAERMASVLCLDVGVTEVSEGRGDDSVRDVALGKCDVSCSMDSRAGTADEKENSVLPIDSERERCVNPESLLKVELLNTRPCTPVVQALSTQHVSWVHAAGFSGAEVARSIDGSMLSSWREELTIVAQTQLQQGDDDERFSTGESPADMPAEMPLVGSPVFDVLSPATRLDATHIEEDDNTRTEERLRAETSHENEGLMGVTMLETSQCGNVGGCFGVDTAADGKGGALFGVNDQCTSTLRPRRKLTATAEASCLENEIHRSSWEVERSVSVESARSLPGIGRSRAGGCGANIPDSGDHRESYLYGPDFNGQEHSSVATASVHSEGFDRRSHCSREPNGEDGKQFQCEGDAEINGTEPPEVVRQGLACGAFDGDWKDPVFDPGSWRTGAGGHGRLRGDVQNDVGNFTAQSLNASVGDRTFGSAPSPAIVGLTIDGSNAPSPLTLAEHTYAGDVGDCQNGGREYPVVGGESPGVGSLSPVRSMASNSTAERSPGVVDLSPVRSMASDSTAERSIGVGDLSPVRSVASGSTAGSHRTTPVRPKELSLNDEDAPEEATRTSNASRFSVFRRESALACGNVGEGIGIKDLRPPPPAPQRPLGKHQKAQIQQVSARQSTTPERHHTLNTRDCAERCSSMPTERLPDKATVTMFDQNETAPGDDLLLDPLRAHSRVAGEYNQQVSIGSFSESEICCSRFGHEGEGVAGDDQKKADASLVEGTPRRRGVGSGEDLAGFYAPLLVRAPAAQLM